MINYNFYISEEKKHLEYLITKEKSSDIHGNYSYYILYLRSHKKFKTNNEIMNLADTLENICAKNI